MQSSSSSSSNRFMKLLLVPYNKVKDKRNLNKGYTRLATEDSERGNGPQTRKKSRRTATFNAPTNFVPPPPPPSKAHPFVAAVESGRRKNKRKAPAPPLDKWVRL